MQDLNFTSKYLFFILHITTSVIYCVYKQKQHRECLWEETVQTFAVIPILYDSLHLALFMTTGLSLQPFRKGKHSSLQMHSEDNSCAVICLKHSKPFLGRYVNKDWPWLMLESIVIKRVMYEDWGRSVCSNNFLSFSSFSQPFFSHSLWILRWTLKCHRSSLISFCQNYCEDSFVTDRNSSIKLAPRGSNKQETFHSHLSWHSRMAGGLLQGLYWHNN